MDKLGFTFKAVRAANPKIVYAAAIGFGRHGRYAGKPAYDDVIQAASGFAGLFQMRDGAPLYAPTIAADKVSGLHLAYARDGGPALSRAHRRSTRLRRGADVRADGGLQPVRAPERTPPSRRTARSATCASSRRAAGPTRPRTAGSACCRIRERNWVKILTEIGRADVCRLPTGSATPPSAAARVDELYDILAVALVVAHDGGVARHLRAARHPLPAGAAAGRPPEGPPPRPTSDFFKPNFSRPHAGHTHPAPGRERRGDDRRPGLGPAPARRRHRRHPARSRLQRGGDRRGAAATVQDRCRRAGRARPKCTLTAYTIPASAAISLLRARISFASVMTEKSAPSRQARFGSGLLDLNHTKI